jgi:hypothetical protein
MQAHEDRIIKALEDKGYKFDSREELEHFAKTECHVIIPVRSQWEAESKIRHLYVGSELICTWSEEINVKEDGGRFTVIMG